MLASHARRASIGPIDRATLPQWQDDTTRTTYVFDLCSPARTASWPALAASDLAELGFEDVLVLEGGNAAWCGAGLTPSRGPTYLLLPRDDVWLAASERPGDERANVMAYLAWETSLLAQIARGGCVRTATSCGTNGAGVPRDSTCSKVP